MQGQGCEWTGHSSCPLLGACLWPDQPPFPALSRVPRAGFPGLAELRAWPHGPPVPSHSPLPLEGRAVLWGSRGEGRFLNHWHPIPQPTQVVCRGAQVQKIGPVAQIPQTPSFSGQETLDVQLSPTCPLDHGTDFHPHPWSSVGPLPKVSLVWGKLFSLPTSLLPSNGIFTLIHGNHRVLLLKAKLTTRGENNASINELMHSSSLSDNQPFPASFNRFPVCFRQPSPRMGLLVCPCLCQRVGPPSLWPHLHQRKGP